MEVYPCLPSGKHRKNYWTWPFNYSGFTHKKWGFLIAMLVYQRIFGIPGGYVPHLWMVYLHVHFMDSPIYKWMINGVSPNFRKPPYIWDIFHGYSWYIQLDLVGIYNGMYLVYLDLLKMIFLPLDYSLLGESATQEYVSVLFGLRQIHLVIWWCEHMMRCNNCAAACWSNGILPWKFGDLTTTLNWF